mmetsp:Transcript_12963/g.27501  ORF Transcript_12963/g.27501 Transcript_12963/m.27501 type:complete len:209 (+) Transcript_12963:207-833(+)
MIHHHHLENSSSQIFPPQNNLLLFKIPPILLIHQNQIQKVSHRESMILGMIRRRDIGGNPLQKQSDRNNLPFDRRPVHNFVFEESLRLCDNILYFGVGVTSRGSRPRNVVVIVTSTSTGSDGIGRHGHALPARLPSNDRQLHVFDLDPHQKKMDLPANHVSEMKAPPFVLELDVETVFDAHLHFDGFVDAGFVAPDANEDFVLLGDVG